MANPYVLTQGDSLSRLRVRCKYAQTELPIDLSGSTLKFRCKIDGQAVDEWDLVPVAPNTDGIAEYQLDISGADLPVAGTMRGQVQITSATRVMTSIEDFIITVKRRVA